MPLIDKGFKTCDEKCRCGRPMREIHCTDCGSIAIERLARGRWIEAEDRTKVLVRVFHCRRCKYEFDEVMRYDCAAPDKGLTMRAQRVADRISEETSGMFKSEDERKSKLNELFANMKRKP